MALGDFQVGVRPLASLDLVAFNFHVRVQSAQTPLADFAVAVHRQQALADFRVHVRSVPAIQPVFAASIQRPVGRVEI